MDMYPSIEYLTRLAREAGKITRDGFNLKRDWTVKEDTTPLTITDTKINDLVVESLHRDFPHVNVLGEEGNREVADAEYTVMCDPVDGTIPFSLGLPISSFVIAVIKGEHPIASVIYDPFENRLWHAKRGAGSFMNGQPVRVSTCATLKQSNVHMVWWGWCGHNLHEVAERLMKEGTKLLNPGTLAYLGGLIASGTLEATVFPGPGAWETAAMQVIVEEAGGRVTDLYGNLILYKTNGFKLPMGSIVSNGALHEQLLQILSEHGLPFEGIYR